MLRCETTMHRRNRSAVGPHAWGGWQKRTGASKPGWALLAVKFVRFEGFSEAAFLSWLCDTIQERTRSLHVTPREMNDIVDRICNSSALRNRQKLGTLLRYLVAHDEDPGALSASGLVRSLGSHSQEGVRIQCARLRAALRYYFLFSSEGMDEPEQLDLPTAMPDERTQYYRQRYYKIIRGPDLHKLGCAEAFWRAHFLSRHDELLGTLIVFTEPLVFWDIQHRLLIRHLDVNDREDVRLGVGGSDPVAELMKKVPWIKNLNDIVPSRGYVPSGQVIAKESLRAWFLQELNAVKDAGGGAVAAPSLFVQETISRQIRDINNLDNRHCILLGSSRDNWLIRFFQHQTKTMLPFTLEADVITLSKCTSADYRRMEALLMELSGGDITSEDLKKMIWRKQSEVMFKDSSRKLCFALVSRALDHSNKLVITVLSSNQGRGIQALGEHILTRDDSMNEIFASFGISPRLPKAFQMLFAILLTEQESGYSKAGWRLLAYRAAR